MTTTTCTCSRLVSLTCFRTGSQSTKRFVEGHSHFLGRGKRSSGWSRQGGGGRPPIVKEFEIRPRFESIRDYRTRPTEIAIFLRISLNWSISSPIEALREAGVDLAELHVVRRNPSPDERRLVGTISRSRVIRLFSRSPSMIWRPFRPRRCRSRGARRPSLAASKMLGATRYQHFESERYRGGGDYRLGPSLQKLLDRMRDVL